MDSDLNQAVSKAIADNLPEQTARELRAFIERAEDYKHEAAFYKTEAERFQTMLSNREDEIGRLRSLELIEKDTKARNDALGRQREEFEIEKQYARNEIAIREVHANEKVTLMRDLVGVGLMQGSFCATNCKTGCVYEGSETSAE